MDGLIGKEIILGTYEAFVLGYKLSEDKKSLVKAFCCCYDVFPNFHLVKPA
jgi:hypothetical protein